MLLVLRDEHFCVLVLYGTVQRADFLDIILPSGICFAHRSGVYFAYVLGGRGDLAVNGGGRIDGVCYLLCVFIVEAKILRILVNNGGRYAMNLKKHGVF